MNVVELYKTDDGETQVEVRFIKETVWLTLNQFSELYGREKSVISRHLNNFLILGVNHNATVAKNATVQTEGKRQVEIEPKLNTSVSMQSFQLAIGLIQNRVYNSGFGQQSALKNICVSESEDYCLGRKAFPFCMDAM